jgi:hypothetical protein
MVVWNELVGDGLYAEGVDWRLVGLQTSLVGLLVDQLRFFEITGQDIPPHPTTIYKM